jgi:hypothetical protein
MKLILKLVILGILIFFLLDLHEGHESRVKVEDSPSASGKGNSDRDQNIASTRIYREAGNEPFMTGEVMVQERRINNQPPDPTGIPRERNLARAASIEWIKTSTMYYSPESWYLLMQYDNLPSSAKVTSDDGKEVSTQKTTGTFQYLRGRTRFDMLVSMETNIHEVAHGYYDQNVFRYIAENNLEMNLDNAQGYIYLSPSRGFFISFPLMALFPSQELNAVIPEDLRTYRFDTYINGKTSTQSEGVIGLLNELHAYYIGSKYCFDMLDAYKTVAGSDAAGLFEWVTHTQSTMTAFYEFDFFIREYLLYMKKIYAANYEKLKLYRPFTEAYMTIYTLYKELIDNYQERIKDEVKLLNLSGNAEAKIEKGWLWVRAENSNVSSGAPIFSEYWETLLKMLESRRYTEIERDFPVR